MLKQGPSELTTQQVKWRDCGRNPVGNQRVANGNRNGLAFLQLNELEQSLVTERNEAGQAQRGGISFKLEHVSPT